MAAPLQRHACLNALESLHLAGARPRSCSPTWATSHCSCSLRHLRCALPLQDALAGNDASLIQAFVQSGGGLITGAQAWYWSYANPVENHPSNTLLAPM